MMKYKGLILAVIAGFVLTLACCSSCTRIDAGHEGIRVKQYGTGKGVQDVSLVTGRVWFNPFTEEIHQFPVFVQTADYEPFSVNAKDGSVFTVDPTITFKVIAGRSPEIFKKYRKDITEITRTTLFNYVRDAFRIQFNKYSTDSMISNREGFENAVQIQLSTELSKEGFDLEQMTSGITYPESITQAIDAKNRAVQQAMQVENELRVAEANARKLIVQAEAEAKANLLRQQSLTPLLIQQQFIEKWDGKTPLYGSSPVMFKSVQ
ncbi:prohibitin family protein [Chitinophaga sp. GCM10012297]|uniref:Prohibitin family protein n=1 Tax=Chitinophaga chungangae TaxID=2821488 RepID=A0ABS3YGG9_9BACT|nr:prohibitin family protein [Chitinophaga chungangae]MBO9153778.1 prohibitin family protein [Chitinophaga chungangae]